MSEGTARLVYMLNQIATAFRTQGHEPAVQAVLQHVIRFWDPRMRRMMIAHLGECEGSLNEIAREAAHRLVVADRKHSPEAAVAGGQGG